MKFRILIFTTLALGVMVFASCSKDEDEVAKTTFELNIKPILVVKCAGVGCHINSTATSYDIYDVAKLNVDKFIARIQLEKTDPKFMPLGGEKLAQADIDLIKKWKTDGLGK